MKVFPVLEGDLERGLEIAAPFLLKVLEKSTADIQMYDIDDVRDYVISGQWELFIFVDDEQAPIGAATVVYQQYPKCLVAFGTLLGGKGIATKEYLQDLIWWTKQQGASIFQCFTSAAANRLYKRIGFTSNSNVTEIML